MEPEDHRGSTDGERALWEELHKINLELKMYRAEREEYRPKIDQLIEVLTVSKGLVTLIRAMVFIAAPVIGVIYWFKDHLK